MGLNIEKCTVHTRYNLSDLIAVSIHISEEIPTQDNTKDAEKVFTRDMVSRRHIHIHTSINI